MRACAVMDIRTLRIGRDWFTIVQDRQQWSAIYEQIRLYLTILWKSVWRTDPLTNKHFLGCVVVSINILDISKDFNHIVALNIWTVEIWRL